MVGGGGYVGPVLTEHLLDRGYRIRNMDLFLYANQAVLAPFAAHPRFEMVDADHCDAAQLAKALDGVSDAVILSGLVGDPITRKYPDAHRIINHELTYVDADTHTQGIEGYWSILKRVLYGVFHHVDQQYLPQYLNEFEFRFNRRKIEGEYRFASLMGQKPGRVVWFCQPTHPGNPPS